MKKASVATAAVALLAALAGAEDFSGRYRIEGEQGPVILELKQSPDGELTGSVSGFGTPIQVAGRAVPGGIQGQLRSAEGASVFEGQLVGETLRLSVADVGPFGQPDPSTLQQFELEREDPARASDVPSPAASSRAIADPSEGYALEIPEGWEARRTAEGLVLGSRSEKGLMLVLPHEHATLAAVRSEAAQGIVDEGVSLAPRGQPVPFGETGLAAEFQGTAGGQPARAYAVALLSPYGGGATVAVIVESASFGEAHRGGVDALARSFRFTKPQAPPEAQGWQQKLAGYCLAYRSSSYSSGASFGGYGTYSGFSDSSNYFLGADGSFASDASSSSSFDGGGGFGGVHSGSGPQGGRWRIGGSAGAPTLEIQYGDERSIVHRLSSDERGRTYLDGDRWLRVTFEECRAN